MAWRESSYDILAFWRSGNPNITDRSVRAGITKEQAEQLFHVGKACMQGALATIHAAFGYQYRGLSSSSDNEQVRDLRQNVQPDGIALGWIHYPEHASTETVGRMQRGLRTVASTLMERCLEVAHKGSQDAIIRHSGMLYVPPSGEWPGHLWLPPEMTAIASGNIAIQGAQSPPPTLESPPPILES